MKTPDQVGRDFDQYAKRWKPDDYRLEIGYGPDGVIVDAETKLSRPGDEWGDVADLARLYGAMFRRLLPSSGDLRIVEIGAGGGRSTEAVVSAIGSRIAEYHVVDVSAALAGVLRERLPDLRPTIHLVADVDLSKLPSNRFDICLAQSSWSHIGFYDQYRYLRDLPRIMKDNAPVVVNGHFVLGLGDDWSWDRFRRRVYQIDHQIDGVFHEFSGIGVLVEQLLRLEYQIELIHNRGFVARCNQTNAASRSAGLVGPLSYPYLPRLLDYVEGETPRLVELN